MKINKLAALLKKSGTITLYGMERTRTQWVGDGAAAYPLLGLPYLEESSLYTMFDINERQQDKLHFQHVDLPDNTNFADTDDCENIIESGKISLATAGHLIRPLQTQKGIVFIDTKYLAPLSDTLVSAEFYERISPSGQVYIAVKSGFMLMGVIFPYDLISQLFVAQLEDLTNQCRFALEEKTKDDFRGSRHITFPDGESGEG